MSEAGSSIAPRTALYLPASNPRAIAKARTLAVDLVILDLEDAVKPCDKDAARAAAVDAVGQGMGCPAAIRINGEGAPEHAADVAAVAGSAAALIVLPKVDAADIAAAVAAAAGKPLLAMIETPRGVIAAAEIAAAQGVRGLIAGTNDLAHELRLPPSPKRAGLALALQTIVLAARAKECWALDGVFNALDDPQGFATECREGRALGFDGKTLIHPAQIAIATAAFSASEAELEDARALIAAANGGAERFRDRMIEAMHVDAARALLTRAEPGHIPPDLAL